MKCAKVIVPFFSMTLLVVSDYVLILAYKKTDSWFWQAKLIFALYQFLFGMALISLWRTWFANPGHIKKDSVYSMEKLSPLVREIYASVIQY